MRRLSSPARLQDNKAIATAQTSTRLSGNFVGTVRLGPNKDMVWKGLLKLSISNSGAVSGTLAGGGEGDIGDWGYGIGG